MDIHPPSEVPIQGRELVLYYMLHGKVQTALGTYVASVDWFYVRHASKRTEIVGWAYVPEFKLEEGVANGT